MGSFMWYIVDFVFMVNVLEVFCFWGNWLLGNEDRCRVCVMFSYVSWSDERNWKKKKYLCLYKWLSGICYWSYVVYFDDKFMVYCVMIG